MTLIYAYKGRGLTKDIVINSSGGTAITPGTNDLVRISIGRVGEDALFSVTSGTPTSNGSSITKGALNRLRIDASDLEDIDPGTYTLFVDYFDNADAQEWKTVDRQVFVLEDE
jgi:hypothetical protein